MDLNVKPTAENVEQLKKYVEKLPTDSPYVWLVNYEQQLVTNNKSTRALARICNSDKHLLINKLEDLTNENWLRVSNLTDFNDIPNNYFNVVLWSDCDIESELRQVLKIYPKLQLGARVYFNNLLSDFGALLKKCLAQKDLEKLFGQKLSKVLETSAVFAHLVRTILEAIFSSGKDKYTVKIIQHGDTRYLVFVKGELEFLPEESLAKHLTDVDQQVAKKFPEDKSLGKLVLDGALMRTRYGIKAITISKVKEGKLDDALARVNEMLAFYSEIEGVNSRVDTMATLLESLDIVGIKIPE